MARGHWRRYPRKSDGSRRAGYFFVRGSRVSVGHKESGRDTVEIKYDQHGHEGEDKN